MSSVCYTRTPIRIVDGVPVFMETDDYVENYEKIAQDHLAALDANGANPFMLEEDWVAMEQSTEAIIRQVIAPDDCLFDAGVGLGRLLSRFSAHERHGVDISLDYLKRAAGVGIQVAAARLEDVPYPDAAFDLITATDVLEHVLDLYRVSSELVRLLRPGGHLIVRVPFEEDLKSYYDYRDYDLVHLRRFDLWGLRILFERVFGLAYIEHSTVSPKWRGLPYLRIAPTADGEALRACLEDLPGDLVGVEELRAFSYLSPEMLATLMNAVATDQPAMLPRLEDLLAKPMEINIVFRKPEVSPGRSFSYVRT